MSNVIRKLTYPLRPYPHFIIIGAMKCGTTSLYHYLNEHHQLTSAFKKEVHYFDSWVYPKRNDYMWSHKWYRINFPITLNKTFEASPSYIFVPAVAKRIYELLPKTKLVVLLRNPTERAISHYFHTVRLNLEYLPLMQALKMEDSRLKNAYTNNDSSLLFYSYTRRGLYKSQLEIYFKYFPREQIHIINSEQFFKNPQNTVNQLCDFLNIDRYIISNTTPQNIGNKLQIPTEVYEYLNSYFKPHNEKLYELIGVRYDWNK